MRTLAATTAALGAIAASAATAHSMPDPRAGEGLASVRLTACHVGLTTGDRMATFRARMRRIPTARSLRMRFTLYQRTAGGASRRVPTAALATWRRSRPGVASFAYSQTVDGLQPGGDYAMTVEYRWIDAAGRVIRRAQRSAGNCHETGPLAALKLASISASRDPGGAERYSVALTNTGATEVSGTDLSLYVDHAAPQTAPIAPIAAGQTEVVELRASACVRRLRLVAVHGPPSRQRSGFSGACPTVH